MVKSKLFIETTIPISKVLDNNKTFTSDLIDNIITGFESVESSSYVQMEYKRRFIRDIVYLNNMCWEDDVADVGDVHKRLSALSSAPQQQRKLSITLSALALFFKEDKMSASDVLVDKNILERMRIYFNIIVSELSEYFENNYDCLHNQTNCFLSQLKPVSDAKCEGQFRFKIPYCKRSEKKCSIDEFIQKNVSNIENILTKLKDLDNVDEEQKKSMEILEMALRDKDVMLEYKNCWKCGDIIIALECPEDAMLMTTNIKHYSILCDSLNKNYYK